jgi:hypothetical protein
VSWAVLASSGDDTARRLARAHDLPTVDDPRTASQVVHTGGDASLAELVGLLGPSVPILHHPLVASDLARMFGSGDLAERLSHGAPYPIEVIELRSEVARYVAVGHVIASRTGRLPNPLVKTRRLAITRDGRDDSAEGAAVVVANCQHVGDVTIAPRAALMDGRVDLQVLGGNRVDRLRLRRSIRRGLHLRNPAVLRRAVSTMAFDLPYGWRMRSDGTAVTGSHWDLAVLPNAATLWV